MTSALAFFLAFITTSVGIDTLADPYIDPAFRAYVAEFEAETQLRANKNPIVFGEMLEDDWVAYCSSTNGRIYVDRRYWQRAPEHTRLILIAHELGHCLLGREHDTRKIVGQPFSLMYPYLGAFDSDHFWKLKKIYFRELLTGRWKFNCETKPYFPKSKTLQLNLNCP
jgi:hypothetical protein